MRVANTVVVAVVVCLCGVGAQAVTIDAVTVGNPGNAGEWSGESYGGYGPDRICGAVGYVYDVGKYEVTAGQYCEFLNAVAATDTYGLYNPYMWDAPWEDYGCRIQRSGSSGSYTYSVAGDWADRPANYVSWGDAARFSNWLHNGQPTGGQGPGTTEDGSYFLDGAMTDAELLAITREPDATWAIPTEDEWYKAAYHKNDGATGNYFDYPTSSDSVPGYVGDGESIPDPDPGNYATYDGDGGIDGIGSPYYLTEIGEHENSDSPYGAFDQGGNLQEWDEALAIGQRGLRGGSFKGSDSLLHAAYRHRTTPLNESDGIGFRLVYVPEPATLSLLALGGLAVLRRLR